MLHILHLSSARKGQYWHCLHIPEGTVRSFLGQSLHKCINVNPTLILYANKLISLGTNLHTCMCGSATVVNGKIYCTLPQIFHFIKGASQSQIPSQLRPFTVIHFMRRSHLLPDQLPMEHTGHKAVILWLPNWHSHPTWNAHIPPLATTARHQFYTLVR